MKKYFEEPEMNVITVSCEDVLTTSGEGDLGIAVSGSWETQNDIVSII